MKLKDGEPCPLCGSEHHPYAHEHTAKDDTLETNIKELEKNVLNSNKELHQLEAEFTSLEKRKKEQLEKLRTIQLRLETNQTDFSEKYNEFSKVNHIEEIEKITEQLEEKAEALTRFEDLLKKTRALKTAIPLAKELKDTVIQGKELKKQLDSIYKGTNIQNDVQQISNHWSRLQQEQLNLNERSLETGKQIKNTSESLSAIECNLNVFINKLEFDSIKTAWKALMPEAEASKLRSEKQQISKRIDDSKASIKLLQDQLLKLKAVDVEVEEVKLQEQLEEISGKHMSLNNECKELERILKNQEDRLQRMKKLKLEIEQKEKQTKRWRLLNELIGDSKGKSFNDFAQDLTLSQLLKLANIRLQDLSDRYLIDKPEPEEDDGLVAIDEHMGGQRRSVKTLSGGETFILSLSMALALSDLASKNVEINSLFIDEGFGTLDPETLDQTLDTLEKLQSESSKTIGIISHVDSLKERISTQIKLSRNGQGYSSLKIT